MSLTRPFSHLLLDLVTLLLVTEQATAQTHTFVKHFGGNQWDYARAIKASPSGDGYYIAGTTRSFGGYSMLLMEISPEGDSIWSREYGSAGVATEAFDICFPQNNRVCFAGAGLSSDPWDGYIMQAELGGALIGGRVFNGNLNSNDHARTVAATEGLDLVMAGTLQGSSDYPMVVERLDDTLGIVWSMVLTTQDLTGFTPFCSIESTKNSILIGERGGSAAMVGMFSAGGTLMWMKQIPGRLNVKGIVESRLNNFVCVANDEQSPSRVFLFALNQHGDVIWSTSFEDSSLRLLRAEDLVMAPDSGFAICGYHRMPANDYDAFILKTDKNGGLEWMNRFGGADHDYGYAIDNTVEADGFIVTGETYSFTNGINDVLVIRTDDHGKTNCEVESVFTPSIGDTMTAIDLLYTLTSGYTYNKIPTYSHLIQQDLNTICDTTISSIPAENLEEQLLCYPNPADEFMMIATEGLEGGTLRVYNVHGQPCMEQLVTQRWTSLRTSNFSDGVYIFRITNDSGGSAAGRAIVQH
jgi:hypothetical protein